MQVYIERGKKRVFAGALEWPGWCRSARDEGAALDALRSYAPRYAAVLPMEGFPEIGDLEVAERLDGDATTDFGAPSQAPAFDRDPLDQTQAQGLVKLLAAFWERFDEGVTVAGELRKGPRGGGREAPAIFDHVNDAQRAYLSKLGAAHRQDPSLRADEQVRRVRETFVSEVLARAAGAPPARTPRSGSLWSPRYAVRRSAWHVLDHLWEIEDRSTGSGERG